MKRALMGNGHHYSRIIAGGLSSLILFLLPAFFPLTLHAATSTDSVQADFDLGSYTNTQYDAGNTWVELNSTGLTNGSGSFVSRIFDSSFFSAWSTIAWTPERPMYKELPNNRGAETGYGTGNFDMASSSLLLHMNETSGTSFSDSSGQSHTMTCVTLCPTLGGAGKFDKAFEFFSTSDYRISTADFGGAMSNLAISFWFKDSTLTGNFFEYLFSWGTINASNSINIYWIEPGNATRPESLQVAINDSGENTRQITIEDFKDNYLDGEWHHFALTKGAAGDSASGTQIYLDGVEADSFEFPLGSNNVADLTVNPAGALYIGGRNDNNADRRYDGMLDEFSFWNRSLTPTEISDLYKRGANRLQFHIRSCNDASCAEETFIGPDGTAGTYYSELSNTSLTTPSLTPTNLSANRYLQYKAFFESDSATFTPELNTVSLGSDSTMPSNPAVHSFTPTDNATSTSVSNNLSILFTEAVAVQTGNITIKRTSDDADIEIIPVSDARVTGSGTDTITINPTADLADSTELYVLIDATAFDDLSGNSYEGISATTTWSFTTEDLTDPSIVSLSPADNAVGANINTNLVIEFDAPVVTGTGAITIKRTSDDATIETIAVGSGQVTGSGTETITIDPSVTLDELEEYYVLIDATAFDDLAGNSFAGISDSTAWSFTAGDVDDPTIQSHSPADNATGVDQSTNLVLVFNEAVTGEDGDIVIKRTSDDAIIETIAADGGLVSGSGSTTITIDPSVILESFTEYYVLIDAAAFDDLFGNSFAGISSATEWSFTTGDTALPTVTRFIPGDGYSGISRDSNLVVVFSESVTADTGSIIIKKTSDDSTIETIPIGDPKVGGSGTATITINPATTLDASTGYYIQIGTTALKDATGNYFAGLSDTTTWNFTTGTTANPTIGLLSPADNAIGFSITGNLVAYFTEPVTAQAVGNITLKRTVGDTTVETMAANGARITGSGTNTITIDPTAALSELTEYYILIDSTAFKDTGGDSFGGISNTTDWSFTTGDTTLPLLSTVTPTDNATSVSQSTALTLNFNEAVIAGEGDIVIKRTSDDVTVRTIPADSYHVTGTSTAAISVEVGGNVNTESAVIRFNVAAAVDTAPPLRSQGAPEGELAFGTTAPTLSLITNENATCRYSTTDQAYGSMAGTFTGGGGTTHTRSLSGLTNGQSYTYYVRCVDGASNTNTDSYPINFSIEASDFDPTDVSNLRFFLTSTFFDDPSNYDLNVARCQSDYCLEETLAENQDITIQYCDTNVFPGGCIKRWEDYGPAELEFGQDDIEKPGYIDECINGHACARGAHASSSYPYWPVGSPHRWAQNLSFEIISPGDHFDLTGAFSIYHLARPVPQTSDYYLYGLRGLKHTVSNHSLSYHVTDGSTTTVAVISKNNIVRDNQWQLFEIHRDSSNTVTVFVNGVDVTKSGLAPLIGNARFGNGILSQFKGISPSFGEFAGTAVFDRKLSTEEQENIREYFDDDFDFLGGTGTRDYVSPVMSDEGPSTQLASGTTNTTLTISTDEAATCRYSSTDETYYEMDGLFSGTGTAHTAGISGLQDGTAYTYYVRCEDGALLDDQTEYYVLIDATAFDDTTGNSYAGIATTTTWSFTTGDTTAPIVETFQPVDNTFSVATSTGITIAFSEAVVPQSGNITIKRTLDNSTVEVIPVTSSQVVATSTNSSATYVTIKPTDLFDISTEYYVLIDSTAFDDLAGNSFAGVTDTTTWSFKTTDVSDPVVISLSPVDDATQVSTSSDLVVTFDEEVIPVEGNILIRRSSDSSVFETIGATSTQVTGASTSVITINPSVNFEESTGYYVEIDAVAFDDLFQHSFAGISGTSTWNFTTTEYTPPTISTLTPLDNATDVASTTNLTLVFTEAVIPQAATNITIKKTSDNTTVATIPATDGQVIGSSTNTIVINPTANLPTETELYVLIDAAAFKDLAGNSFAGIASTTAWSFSTADETLPTLDSKMPADNATAIATSTNLTLGFSEAVTPQSGKNFIIKKTSDTTTVATIAVTSGHVTGSSTATIVVNPTNDLPSQTELYVLIDSGAFLDATGNAYGGISSTTEWSFTTVDETLPTLDSKTPADNATTVATTTDLTIVFSEPVSQETGDITIKRSSDNQTIETIAVESGDVTGDGTDTISVNRSIVLAESTGYYVLIDSSAFDDLAGNSFAGIAATTTWNFTTAAPVDVVPPTLSSVSPVDNATGTAPTMDLSIVFTEPVSIETGTITIHRTADDQTIETIDVTGGAVTGDGTDTITIDRSVVLADGVEYYVLVDATAFDDLSANSFAGISDPTVWSFTTSDAPDTTNPTLLSHTPTDDATDIASTTNLTLTFDEAVTPGSGNVVIHRTSDDSIVETIPTGSGQVSGDGTAVITIDLGNDLAESEEYYVLIDTDAFEDLSGNAFPGIVSTTVWSFETAAAVDATTPTLVFRSPTDDQTAVATTTDLILTFDEPVTIETGDITINRSSDDALIESIDVTSGFVTGSGSTTIDVGLSVLLDFLTEYYVLIPNTAFEDFAGNAFAGISSPTAWSFTTADAVDTTAPLLSSVTPLDDATDVATTTNLVMVFNEAVTGGDGDIVIYQTSDDSVIETIPAGSGQVSGAGTGTLTINPITVLAEDEEYYILVDADAFEDLAENAFAGISDTTDWSFTTAAPVSDTTDPTLVSKTPADNAVDVAPSTNVSLTFTEPVTTETGTITIKRASDDTTVETIVVTSGQVTGSGTDTITINPSTDFPFETELYVLIEATAFDDVAGNSFAGISSETDWSFTTEEDDSDNGDDDDSGGSSGGGGGGGSSSSGRSEERNTAASGQTPTTSGTGTTGSSITTTTGSTGSTPTPSLTRDLQSGSSGNDVRELQRFLNTHGFPVAIAGPGSLYNETTLFGPLTRDALARFQAANGIVPAVGYLGPITRAAIARSGGSGTMIANTPIPAVAVSSGVGVSMVRDLQVGMEGNDVRMLQQILISQGYAIPAGATGFFVEQTRAALAAYQQAHGIMPAAGYFGPKTREVMKGTGIVGVWW